MERKQEKLAHQATKRRDGVREWDTPCSTALSAIVPPIKHDDISRVFVFVGAGRPVVRRFHDDVTTDNGWTTH